MGSTERVALFDNARGLLIILVAVGHALEPFLPSSALARGLYSAIYLFHIPAFAFLSGQLSHARWDPIGVLKTLIAPLILFQALYVCFDVFALGHPLDPKWLWTPYWILWFLLSLASWRLLLPLLVKTRAPFVVSVLLALAAGLIPQLGYPLSLSRTFVFLPFFVAGFVTPRAATVSSRRFLFPAALAFVLLAAWAWAIATGRVPAPDTQWLYGSRGYSAIGVDALAGLAIRGAILAAALALSWAFFVLAPRGSSPLTRYGAASLTPFLLHGFFIRAAEKAGLFARIPIAAAIACAIVLVLLLGTPPVIKATRRLVQPLR